MWGPSVHEMIYLLHMHVSLEKIEMGVRVDYTDWPLLIKVKIGQSLPLYMFIL